MQNALCITINILCIVLNSEGLFQYQIKSFEILRKVWHERIELNLLFSACSAVLSINDFIPKNLQVGFLEVSRSFVE